MDSVCNLRDTLRYGHGVGRLREALVNDVIHVTCQPDVIYDMHCDVFDNWRNIAITPTTETGQDRGQ